MNFTIIDSATQLNVNGMFLLILYIFFSYLISRRIVNANIFNIASFSLFIYWATYPLESLKIDGDMYSSISGIKERGIILYAIFGFTFLIGSYIVSKANLPRFRSLPKVNTLRYLIPLSIISGSLGLFCFLYSYNFSINQYFFSIFNLSRIDRLEVLSKSNNVLPYSIFFIPSVIAILISLKSINFKKFNSYLLIIFISIIINIPICISYIVEGDRTSLIKLLTVIVFTISLNKKIPKSSLERKFLIKNFKLNKEILIKRIKLSIVSLLAIILLIFIGLGRANGWRNTNNIIFNVKKQIELKLLPTSEFRAVNYTIDFVQARPYLTMEKSKDTFTWDKMIFYPLPTYVYKRLFNKKKPLNIGDTIGLETKNYVYGKEKNTKLGFGLSPIAEGYFNLGMFGIAFTGFIYGISIGILQNYYNKITLNQINIFDLIILNSISIVPLIMRSGTAGIYNWIFSTSFILFVIIFFIEFFIMSYNKIKDIS